MTKISNQRAYIPDTEISNEDYYIGTDFDNSLATVNFKVGEVGSHYNMTNGVRNFDYVFYQHQGVSPTPTDGYFYSNGNTQVLEDITYLIFPKKTARGKDSSQFFDSMAIDNPFDLTIAQKIDNNTVFFFTINSIETFANYYKLNVAKVFFPIGKALEYVLSYAVFSLKTEGVSIHNNLLGLNEGDYIHLTAAEKIIFDNLPSTIATQTSELTNDGSDGTSTYVEADEISSLLREEFVFSGNQTFTLGSDYGQVYSVEVQGQGALSSSQYTLVPNNQITINDTLNNGDYIVVIYSTAIVGVQPYYSQAQVDSLVNNKLDKDISTLEAATLPLAGTEEIAIVQSAETKKIAINDLVLKSEDTIEFHFSSFASVAGNYCVPSYTTSNKAAVRTALSTSLAFSLPSAFGNADFHTIIGDRTITKISFYINRSQSVLDRDINFTVYKATPVDNGLSSIKTFINLVEIANVTYTESPSVVSYYFFKDVPILFSALNNDEVIVPIIRDNFGNTYYGMKIIINTIEI